MSKTIDDALSEIIRYSSKVDEELDKEHAFDVLMILYYCYGSSDIEKHWFDIMNHNFTDGKDDGGIDFAYFDEENSKVIIGQNKYSTNMTVSTVTAELRKTLKTLRDFTYSTVQSYNDQVRKNVQNALDSLTEDSEGNIDVVFFSLSEFNNDKVESQIKESDISNMIFLDEIEIEKMIIDVKSKLQLVKEFKFKVDDTGNVLEYNSKDREGIVVNISSNSLIDAYSKFSTDGLFNLNIRRYIKSKSVDDGIKHTIYKDSDNFWFLNNGLTIACKSFALDGTMIKLSDFSIVNGGQTTTLISKFGNKNQIPFYVPCKIVMPKDDLSSEDQAVFFNDIAEATNSQKPIQPRDLKANAPEMLQMQSLLSKHNDIDQRPIYLQIKRGITGKRSHRSLRNDILAQVLFSFVNQKPGTSRSNKKSLFSNNKNYRAIFMQNYAKNQAKTDFLYDLVDLNNRFDELINNIKSDSAIRQKFRPDELDILSNSKTAIFAIMGMFYQLVNEDTEVSDIIQDPKTVSMNIDDYVYGPFFRFYEKDDIDKKFFSLIQKIVAKLGKLYVQETDRGQVTSVSNFFKTDSRYYDVIVSAYADEFRIDEDWETFVNNYGDFFRRH
jgi:hypothetical protein